MIESRGITGIFDVVGAKAPLALFSALPVERLAHGYLFSGPVGVGKKTFARRLAQSLLCGTPKATLLGYCDACADCTLFEARTHPDYLESEGTLKIGKDGGPSDDGLTARELVRQLALRGYRSTHRIVVLGDVAFATHEAANALLKFFEEPPTGTVVLLTTDAPGSLLATIRSRFIELAFPPLPIADVETVLRRDGTSAEHARTAAAGALGSIVRARAILTDGDGGVRGASFAWIAAAVRGEIPDGSFLRLDDRALSGAEKRAAVAELIETSRVALRDWFARGLGDDALPLLASDQRARIARFPDRPAPEIAAMLGSLAELARLATSNVSAGLVADALRIQLAPSAAPAPHAARSGRR